MRLLLLIDYRDSSGCLEHREFLEFPGYHTDLAAFSVWRPPIFVKFEVLAVDTLDDKIDTSPAVVGDELFMKGKTYLYCIPDV